MPSFHFVWDAQLIEKDIRPILYEKYFFKDTTYTTKTVKICPVGKVPTLRDNALWRTNKLIFANVLVTLHTRNCVIFIKGITKTKISILNFYIQNKNVTKQLNKINKKSKNI